MLSKEELISEMKKKGIRPYHKRIRIYEYLLSCCAHPTADEIFFALRQQDLPGLSKTTVYNVLKLFADAELIRVIHIDDNETRYDGVTELHGHFKCESCGNIYNFAVDTERLAATDLPGFTIHDRGVYFKGICPRCLSNKK